MTASNSELMQDHTLELENVTRAVEELTTAYHSARLNRSFRPAELAALAALMEAAVAVEAFIDPYCEDKPDLYQHFRGRGLV